MEKNSTSNFHELWNFEKLVAEASLLLKKKKWTDAEATISTIIMCNKSHYLGHVLLLLSHLHLSSIEDLANYNTLFEDSERLLLKKIIDMDYPPDIRIILKKIVQTQYGLLFDKLNSAPLTEISSFSEHFTPVPLLHTIQDIYGIWNRLSPRPNYNKQQKIYSSYIDFCQTLHDFCNSEKNADTIHLGHDARVLKKHTIIWTILSIIQFLISFAFDVIFNKSGFSSIMSIVLISSCAILFLSNVFFLCSIISKSQYFFQRNLGYNMGSKVLMRAVFLAITSPVSSIIIMCILQHKRKDILILKRQFIVQEKERIKELDFFTKECNFLESLMPKILDDVF